VGGVVLDEAAQWGGSPDSKEGEIVTSDNVTPVKDDSVLSAVLDEIYAAWADNDADAFVAPYAERATAVLPGTYLRSRDAIRTTMADLFAGPLKGSRAKHEVQSVRFVGADAAILISRGGIIPAGQTEPDAESMSLDTWVLSKQDGTWRVEAFHNCPANAA
jgi:uncharacterized protein (TIGR02246 family)